ncbi:hypothetical protein FC41_GL000068 [Lactobacillus hominis DSM 23910 = CRBIP 24.179]|nr:hypothetical protein FC41_GL000068 [Lactobacillus hominis DSM 23910 = CRBIP 24.179]
MREGNDIPMKSNELTEELINVLKKHHTNYTDAKKALDYVNQALLNHLLSKTKL